MWSWMQALRDVKKSADASALPGVSSPLGGRLAAASFSPHPKNVEGREKHHFFVLVFCDFCDAVI